MERGHYAIGKAEVPIILLEFSFAMKSTVIPYYVIWGNVAA